MVVGIITCGFPLTRFCLVLAVVLTDQKPTDSSAFPRSLLLIILLDFHRARREENSTLPWGVIHGRVRQTRAASTPLYVGWSIANIFHLLLSYTPSFLRLSILCLDYGQSQLFYNFSRGFAHWEQLKQTHCTHKTKRKKENKRKKRFVYYKLHGI